MTSEQHRWALIRERAQARLHPDFASRVVRCAQNQKKLGRREYILIGMTAAFCIVTVGIGNWYLGDRIQQSNLERWNVVEAQIQALQKSI